MPAGLDLVRCVRLQSPKLRVAPEPCADRWLRSSAYRQNRDRSGFARADEPRLRSELYADAVARIFRTKEVCRKCEMRSEILQSEALRHVR